MCPRFLPTLALAVSALAGCKQPVEQTFAFSSGGPSRAGVLRVPGGVLAVNDFGVVTLLDGAGRAQWRTSACRQIAVRPALAQAMVVVACAGGDWVGLSADDGKERWRAARPETLAAGLAGDDTHAYAVDTDGTLWAVAAASGLPVWKRAAELKPAKERRSFPAPVAWGGLVLAGVAEQGVVVLDAVKGTLRWRVAGPSVLGMAALEDRAFVLWRSGRMAAVRPEGTIAWSTVLGVRPVSGPSAALGLVWAGTEDGALVGVDPHNGTERARLQLPAVALGRAVALGDWLMVTTSAPEGHLLGFRLGTSTPVFETRVDSPVRTDPVVVDGQLVVSPIDGRVLGLRPTVTR
jgi:outer membrane protein assembly factor BamB